MILELFIVFIAIALISSIVGFTLDIPIFTFVGTILLFFLGLGMLTNGIDYKSGEYEYYQYGNNFTYSNGSATYHWDYDASGIPPTADKGVFLFHRGIEYQYENYDDASHNRMGWFIMMLGILGFILGLFML